MVAKRNSVKKEEFTFGSLFSESFEEYRKNFRGIFKFLILFLGIPLLIISLVKFILIMSNPYLFELVSVPELIKQVSLGAIQLPVYYNIIIGILGVILFFFTIFVSVGLINASLKKQKFSFKELVNFGNKRYWNFILFSIVSGIFMILLFIALIIPGLIFSIYWCLSSYIFLDKKEGILGSLKQSRKMIKGRWWKTLGYSLLIGLIVVVFAVMVSVIQLPTIILNSIHIMNGTQISSVLFGISSLLELIVNFITYLVGIPLTIFLFKNMYLKLKK